MYSEEKIFYVYEWIRPDTNEIFYVGKGSKNRINSLKSRNKHVLNVVKHCKGIDNIKKVKIYDKLTEKDAFNLEKLTIKRLRESIGNALLNISDGGDGSSGWYASLTDVEKERHKEISKSWTGRKHTAEEKEKIAASKRGKTRSKETKEKLSAIRKEMYKSGELTPYWKGKHLSEETKLKISETRLKNKHLYNYKNIPDFCYDKSYMKHLSDLALQKRKYIEYIVFDSNFQIISIEKTQKDIFKKYNIGDRSIREYITTFKKKHKIIFNKKEHKSVLTRELFNEYKNNLNSLSTIENDKNE